MYTIWFKSNICIMYALKTYSYTKYNIHYYVICITRNTLEAYLGICFYTIYNVKKISPFEPVWKIFITFMIV